jgi:hypothetical protein
MMFPKSRVASSSTVVETSAAGCHDLLTIEHHPLACEAALQLCLVGTPQSKLTIAV